MKVSKALLQAMAVSLAVGAATSCDLLGDNVTPKDPSDDSSEQTCNPDDSERPGIFDPGNCPGCGMG